MVALLSPAECNTSRRTSSDDAATTSLRAFGPNRIFTWSGVTAAAGTCGFGAAAGFGRVTGGARRAAAAGVDDAAGARTARHRLTYPARAGVGKFSWIPPREIALAYTNTPIISYSLMVSPSRTSYELQLPSELSARYWSALAGATPERL
jgi:hypothetical protein